jgi:VanZ family protein
MSDAAPAHGSRPARRIGATLAMLAWMALIFVLSHQPAAELVSFGDFDLLMKKGGHFVGYFILGALAWLSTGGWRAAVSVVVLYAISDEFHQTFVPGRMGTVTDVCIDVAGGACAAALLTLVARRRGRARSWERCVS